MGRSYRLTCEDHNAMVACLRSPGRPYLSAPLGLGFEHLKVFLEDALRSLEIGKGGFGNSDGSVIGSSRLQTSDPGNLPSDDNAPSKHVASGQFQFGFCHLAILYGPRHRLS
jgi:hypothetical protein